MIAGTNSYLALVIALLFEWNVFLVCSLISPTSPTLRPLCHGTIQKTPLIIGSRESLIRSLRSVSEKSSVTSTDIDQSSAIRALEKLRDRQKKDLVETERMLEIISGQYDKNHPHQSVSSAAFSTAASLLVGTDYGFVSRSEGPPPTLKGSLANLSLNYGPPSNIFTLGTQQFMRNWKAILGEYSDEPQAMLSHRQLELQEKLTKLCLNTTEIWERELVEGPIDAPLIIKIPYLAVCYLLDAVFEGGYIPARFFLLETVARMPYFSYISMLHLYETLGFWRRSADAKRIHFAEELNEFAHLMIMESLGGDQKWWVRFIAQHSAIIYYFILCGLFAISPSLSYRFSELLETHAVNTYSVFLDNNKDLLKELPPTLTAVNYYSLGQSDPFYAEFQASPIVGHEIRRPGERMQSLYDVFAAISADEGDHASAMGACLDTNATLQSPSIERRVLVGVAALALASYLFSTSGVFDANLIDTADTSTIDAAVSLSSDSTVLAEIAAAAASLSQFVEDMVQVDKENLDTVGETMLEVDNALQSGMLDQLRRFGTELAQFLSKLV